MPEMSALDRRRGAWSPDAFPATTPVRIGEDEPCEAPQGDGGPHCGATPTRVYLGGRRCLAHSPGALAGHAPVVPDPARTVEGLRAAAAAAQVSPARVALETGDARALSPAARAKANAPRDGETFVEPLDKARLNAQARKVWHFMASGGWHTLAAIAAGTDGTPEASVSARIRDFRKPEFGSHTVERRRAEHGGLYEYRLLANVAKAGGE
jgi:hypothetical protein